MLLTGAALVGGSWALGTTVRRIRRPKPSLVATLCPSDVTKYNWSPKRPFIALAPRAAALGTLAAGGSALLLASANGYTPVVLAQRLAAVLENSRYGPLLYVAADTIRPLTFFPDSLMTLISGLIFGPVTGFVVSYIGFATSALVAYGVGRALRQGSPTPVSLLTPQETQPQTIPPESIAGYGGLRRLLARYSTKMQEQPFVSMALMHGMFLHADSVNCLAGYLGLAPAPFLAGAMLGVLPSLTANILVGSSLYGSLAAGAVRFNPAPLVAGGALLVGSIGVARYLQKREADSAE